MENASRRSLVSGRSSVGGARFIIDVMSDKGEVLFNGISVKPGKPTASGVVAGKPSSGCRDTSSSSE